MSLWSCHTILEGHAPSPKAQYAKKCYKDAKTNKAKYKKQKRFSASASANFSARVNARISTKVSCSARVRNNLGNNHKNKGFLFWDSDHQPNQWKILKAQNFQQKRNIESSIL